MLQRVLGLTEGKLVAGDAPLFEMPWPCHDAILKGLDSQGAGRQRRPNGDPAQCSGGRFALCGIFYNMLIASCSRGRSDQLPRSPTRLARSGGAGGDIDAWRLTSRRT